jgi:hypothetical protein
MNFTNKVVNSNTANGEVYSIKHYEIKFVSDMQQVGGFLRVNPTTIRSRWPRINFVAGHVYSTPGDDNGIL